MRVLGALRWMRSKLKREPFGCFTLKGILVGGPPWFGELEMHLHRFWYHSLTPIYVRSFIYSMFYSFMINMIITMFIRIILYMISS